MKSTALGAENIIFISDAHEKFYYESNRQIILRSGIKSLQPFERWSNLLQVTCDL